MHRESVVLRDGRRVYIRPLQPGDRQRVAALLQRLSVNGRLQRFHSAGIRITAEVIDQVTAGHVLVAELADDIVALASYHPWPDRRQAEVGIVVDELHKRCGIGTALWEALTRDARHAGIPRLKVEVLSSNVGMLRLLQGVNVSMKRTVAYGVVAIDIELCPTAAQSPPAARTVSA
jgi:GNAT superfamily N-acetyltransferase